MPSGREIHSPAVYTPPGLDGDVLARMRAPVGEGDEEGGPVFMGGEGDSSEEEGGGGRERVVVGAFPGTGGYY